MAWDDSILFSILGTGTFDTIGLRVESSLFCANKQTGEVAEPLHKRHHNPILFDVLIFPSHHLEVMMIFPKVPAK